MIIIILSMLWEEVLKIRAFMFLEMVDRSGDATLR